MAVIDLQQPPSLRQLRQFSVASLVILPSVTWLGTHDQSLTIVAALAGMVIVVTGRVAPAMLRPVYRGVTIATMPIGRVAGEITLLLIYFGVFLPMAMVFRIAGKDPLGRKPAESNASGWQKRMQSRDPATYFLQF
jgi:hypothetical protein